MATTIPIKWREAKFWRATIRQVQIDVNDRSQVVDYGRSGYLSDPFAVIMALCENCYLFFNAGSENSPIFVEANLSCAGVICRNSPIQDARIDELSKVAIPDDKGRVPRVSSSGKVTWAKWPGPNAVANSWKEVR